MLSGPVAETFEDALHSRYSHLNEGIKLEISNIVEHAPTKIVRDDRGHVY